MRTRACALETYVRTDSTILYIRLITRVSVEYDEIFHELRQYCHEPQASGNTKHE